MKEALKLALDVLERYQVGKWQDFDTFEEAITALRLAIDVQNMASESTYKEALAQPSQQCLDCGSNNIGIPATYDSLINSVKTPQENT